MAISNTALLLTNPDFSNIRSSLVAYLKAQDRFKDIDYAGSNMAVLLDVLSYNTYQNAFLNNMVASEMFLDTAQLKSSVISHAKELGYTPRSKRSAVASVDIAITPTDSPGTIIVPKNTLFSTTIGNQAFTFMTNEARTVSVSNNAYVLEDVNIYEGFLIEETFTVDSNVENQKYQISNFDVDTTSIEVYVSSGGAEEKYNYAASIIGIDSTTPVFFLQQNVDERYEIQFGDGISSRSLAHGTLIRVTYRITSGDLANGAATFKPVSTISGYSTITVTTVANASGGSDEESIESIKRYAPALNQTRGRALTEDDYKVILRNNFPEIQAISVFGGEKVTPPQYGKVIISVDIAGADGIPNIKKEEYYRFLKMKNSKVIEPLFIDPQFLYLRVNSTVYFDYTQTTLTTKDIEALVTSAITTFNTANLNDFDTTFRYSKFNNAIDAAHVAINSNDTSVDLACIVDHSALATVSQKLDFVNAINSTAADAVSSNLFKYDNKVCKLSDELGVLYITNSSNTIKLAEIGTVDYVTGSVTIFPFTIEELYSTTFKVYIKTTARDMIASLNNIIAIDLNDVTVTAVPQRN